LVTAPSCFSRRSSELVWAEFAGIDTRSSDLRYNAITKTEYKPPFYQLDKLSVFGEVATLFYVAHIAIFPSQGHLHDRRTIRDRFESGQVVYDQRVGVGAAMVLSS
jgi:hypothetical protein